MSALFELRTYKILPGKMTEWVEFMEKTIMPYQVSKGMVINGLFKVENDDETFVWIRRFANKEEKERLYKDVYESQQWVEEILPIVTKLIDRNAIKVKNLHATDLSDIK